MIAAYFKFINFLASSTSTQQQWQQQRVFSRFFRHAVVHVDDVDRAHRTSWVPRASDVQFDIISIILFGWSVPTIPKHLRCVLSEKISSTKCIFFQRERTLRPIGTILKRKCGRFFFCLFLFLPLSAHSPFLILFHSHDRWNSKVFWLWRRAQVASETTCTMFEWRVGVKASTLA